MQILLERRVTAIVDETIEYEVDENRFKQLRYIEGYDKEETLEILREEGKATVNNFNSEVDEVVFVHSSELS